MSFKYLGSYYVTNNYFMYPLYFNQYPVKACGLILVHFDNEEPYLLLQKKDNRYEDFGGKVKKTDKDVISTLVREAIEETNGALSASSITDRLQSCSCFYYNARTNYLFAIIDATYEETILVENDFGTHEVNTEQTIKRDVVWVPLSSVNKKNLHPRLFYEMVIYP